MMHFGNGDKPNAEWASAVSCVISGTVTPGNHLHRHWQQWSAAKIKQPNTKKPKLQ